MKQHFPKISTDDGMHSDLSDQHPENAHSSIRFSCEFSSKVTQDSAVQLKKQNLPRISTDAGMRIDSSVEPRA
jgi:hypothetical protein